MRKNGAFANAYHCQAAVEKLVAEEFCQLKTAVVVDAVYCVLKAEVTAFEVARDYVGRVGGEILDVVVGVVVEKTEKEYALLASHGASRGVEKRY